MFLYRSICFHVTAIGNLNELFFRFSPNVFAKNSYFPPNVLAYISVFHQMFSCMNTVFHLFRVTLKHETKNMKYHGF